MNDTKLKVGVVGFLIVLAFLLGIKAGVSLFPRIETKEYTVYLTKEQEACEKVGGTMNYHYAGDLYGGIVLDRWECIQPSKVINHS